MTKLSRQKTSIKDAILLRNTSTIK